MAGNNRIVLACVAYSGVATGITTKTLGGVAFQTAIDTGPDGSGRGCAILYMLDAAIPGTGTQTASIVVDGASGTCTATLVYLEGVNQAAPGNIVNTSGTGTSLTGTPASNDGAGSIRLDCLFDATTTDTPLPGTGQLTLAGGTSGKLNGTSTGNTHTLATSAKYNRTSGSNPTSWSGLTNTSQKYLVSVELQVASGAPVLDGVFSGPPPLPAEPPPEELPRRQRQGLAPFAPAVVADQPPRERAESLSLLETLPEEPLARRLRRTPESVDTIPAPRHALTAEERTEEPAPAPRQRRRFPESVDAVPPARRRSSAEESIEERIARRLLAPPTSVDQPPARLRRSAFEDLAEEVLARLDPVAQPPAAQVDQPPRKPRPRAVEELEPEPRPKQRLPVPLPSGVAPPFFFTRPLPRALDELPPEPRPQARPGVPLPSGAAPVVLPPGLRRTLQEAPGEELPVRQARRLPESVDAPPAARARRSIEEADAERPIVTRALPGALLVPDAAFPLRARRCLEEGVSEEQLPRTLRKAPESIDALPFKPRRRPHEEASSEPVFRRLWLRPPPPVPGDLPVFFRRRTAEEAPPMDSGRRIFGSIAVIAGVVIPAPPGRRAQLRARIHSVMLLAPTRKGTLR